MGDGPGGRLKDWGIYQSWARTVAASGWIGVTFSSRGPATGSGPDIADLFGFLAKEGAPLGIDTSRIAAWVCSANVTSGLKFLMDRAGRGIVGAVVYYGDSDPAKIRTDLPIYYVRAGRDNPDLNARIDRLWARAVAAGAPWEMVNASESHHAFDALDETEESRRIVRETLAFYRDLFQPPPPPPATNAARRALSFWFGHEYAKAEAAYGEFLKTHPNDATAWMRLGLSQAYTKQPAAAEASLERAISLGANGPIDLYNVACAYAVLGEKDRASRRSGAPSTPDSATAASPSATRTSRACAGTSASRSCSPASAPPDAGRPGERNLRFRETSLTDPRISVVDIMRSMNEDTAPPAPESLLPLPEAALYILMSLSDEDRHGYAVIQDVLARTGGEVRLSPGTLYRSIQRMLEQGLIVEKRERPAPEEDDERRRYYRITPLGTAVARAEARRLAELVRLARASGLAPQKA